MDATLAALAGRVTAATIDAVIQLPVTGLARGVLARGVALVWSGVAMTRCSWQVDRLVTPQPVRDGKCPKVETSWGTAM
jgi:hypothetical protein